ncbi:hypothetical protein GF366_02295 [Candidatus Peregrinibacteria bacterium]|nr:hypothetical protein [Candidatus Peregrinibacteria bacterium]
METPEEIQIWDFPLKMYEINELQTRGIMLKRFPLIGDLPDHLINTVEIRILPDHLNTRISEKEALKVNCEMPRAFYELADTIRQKLKAKRIRNSFKPLSLSITVPRMLVEPPEEAEGEVFSTIADTMPANLVEVFQELFASNNPETKNLMNFAQRNVLEDGTNLDLSLELPERNIEEREQIQSQLEDLNNTYGYNLRLEELDLSTALQSAIQRTLKSANGLPVVLYTKTKGPNGGNIIVVSIPGVQIFLGEVQNTQEAGEYLYRECRFPVTSLAIKRSLLEGQTKECNNTFFQYPEYLQ